MPYDCPFIHRYRENKMVKKASLHLRSMLALLATSSCILSPLQAHADDADSSLKISGFVSLVAGRTSGGQLPADYSGPTSIDGHACPCYTADWGNAGVYTNSLSLRPESRAGVQLKYVLTPELNLVGQVVVRGSDTSPNLQWAYASYAPSKNLEFQLGRKRIPLYFYSDFQDIGMSYPWIGVPPELYGWEATNYNGASVRYRTNLAGTNLAVGLFGGKETVKDALYQRLFYSSETRVEWNHLFGADLEASQGPVTARAVYMQADVKTSNPLVGLNDKAKLRAYGLATNLDLDEWFVLTEVTQLTRDFEAGYKITAPAYTLGAGYHYGEWTPFLNFASYKEKTTNRALYAPQSYKRWSLTLRYDLGIRSAVKAQIDRNKDVTRNFGGDTTIMRLSYDHLF